MAIQKRNDELVNMLAGDLQRRYESSFAWRTACSMFQALPGLRGFWPMGVVAGGGEARDQSGLNRILSYNGNPVYDYDGLIPFIRFDGTGDYLSRTDEAENSITGTESYIGTPGLTLGGWFRPEDDATAQSLISKWGGVGNYSYSLSLQGGVAGDPVYFTMSDDGTNTSSVASTTGYSASTWQFVAGRFNDSNTGEELAVWLNDEMTTAATARASIFDGNGDFNISGQNSGSNLYTGRASMCFLCACALDDATVWAIYQLTRALFRV